MTRIIAGEFGGRRLAVPPRGTRPTSDRVREAMFSRLDHAGALHEARVLDLYAGSGALGIEALSRGAAHATLVDAAAAAVRVIERNVRDLAIGAHVSVVREKAHLFLARPPADPPWDVVFADPPYDIVPADLDAVIAALTPHLARDAVLVIENSSRSPAPAWPAGVSTTATKAYGETTLHFAEHVG